MLKIEASVNSGGERGPFVTLAAGCSGDQLHLFWRPTPEKLRELSDELAAQLASPMIRWKTHCPGCGASPLQPMPEPFQQMCRVCQKVWRIHDVIAESAKQHA